MSAKWLRKLHDEYPHLAAQAIALNTRDNFIMHGQKENTEEKEKEKEQERSNKKKDGKKKSHDDSDVSKIKKKKKEKHVQEDSTSVRTNNMQHTDEVRTTQLMRENMGEIAGRKDNEDERKSKNKSKSKSKKRKDDDGY
jgi:hypothetical protein